MTTTPNVDFSKPEVLAYYQKHLSHCDKKFGNNDGKLDIQEALSGLRINDMLKGQSFDDTLKLAKNTANIQEVLTKYAGEDGVLSAQEWAKFQNGKEWTQVMDIYLNSSAYKGTELQSANGFGEYMHILAQQQAREQENK